jgi:hypothetical protein
MALRERAVFVLAQTVADSRAFEPTAG